MKMLLCTVLLMFSFGSNAAQVYIDGKVKSIKMFSDVVIYVTSVPRACNTGQPRVAIDKNDPVFSAVVSSALAAKATDATVQIGYHDSCSVNALSWDFESFWVR